MSGGERSKVGRVVLVGAVIGLLVGAAVAPTVWDRTTGPDGSVAVVELHSTITSDTASTVIDNLREARQNDSIEAVVLDIDSPGGAAAASEQLYLAVKRTRQVMPVVTSVTGMAASGGYYTAVASDEIYVTPASSVGSVGVRATIPTGGVPAGEIVTGPDKGSTATQTEVRQRVESLRRAFVGSVMAERNASLTLSANELSYAKLYSGARGVRLGLADSIGGVDTAISAAASEAGLSDYRVVRMESPTPNVLSQLGLSADADGTASASATFGNQGVETVHYLTLHGSVAGPKTEVVANASA
ncbi:S49 family peptidase [Halarchaeum nitratireducens]|uniref:Peptidase n=1 Tax=Halarchaeum nitratireducens TaxID=489913 RepID=A0A830G9F4_9EURY|nr:S49 family peptidase [Halarchaeum nitratireducens]GGN10002.1 peptidase [Halarchaeum nitratireducens]